MVYCNRCNKDYYSWSAYDQHERDSPHHNVCHPCGIDFTTWVGLKEHWVQSPAHDYCQYCNTHLQDDDELEMHYRNAHDYCHTCCRVFKNALGLEEHYRQSGVHHYCVPCRRHFGSASNLNSHLNSSIHRPKDVKCPDNRCNESFVSASALVLHLESGTCRSGVNRTVVNRVVRANDRNNLITDPSRLITGGGISATREIKYSATTASWNGHAFECYLCHNNYGSLSALNQHLASPRHEDKIYMCRLSTCGAHFSTLSALFAHIESGKCGVAKFKIVQSAMNNLVGGMRLLQ